MAIEIAELDRLQSEYKAAVDAWVAAIREEEGLASEAEHSETDIDAWEKAHFKEEDLRKVAKKAKEHYEDGLRKQFFNF